ncbi:MAG TPA: DNA-formamidopyrimidine glycosylase family protein [Candidatus Xenobia bacterium]|jgi:formamidopyrimidine-DNA glycosylase
MPELPDVTLYIECLRPRIVGHALVALRLPNPFVLRSVSPTVAQVTGRQVIGVERLGKRIVLALEGQDFVVIHLMIAGRLRWRTPGSGPGAPGRSAAGGDRVGGARGRGGARDVATSAGKKIGGKLALAEFEFPTGHLWLTEAGSKRRASLTLVHGEDALLELDRGGIEIMTAKAEDFDAMLRIENHTLKRSLTDPRLFSGIGNAYSDEILHRAKLSPIKQTRTLTADEVTRLYHATRTVMQEWIERLRRETGEAFPEEVTAFRPDMAVHGKYNQPCPACDTPVQRIVFADNETNYCPTCQTGGKLLADRSLSRLLGQDWPRSLEDLEEQKRLRRT